MEGRWRDDLRGDLRWVVRLGDDFHATEGPRLLVLFLRPDPWCDVNVTPSTALRGGASGWCDDNVKPESVRLEEERAGGVMIMSHLRRLPLHQPPLQVRARRRADHLPEHHLHACYAPRRMLRGSRRMFRR
eukprot:7128890-Pyramimonas_sp.AAC.1